MSGPDPETLQIYNTRAADYAAQNTDHLRKDPRLAAFISACRENGHVLDLGCGEGFVIDHLVQAEIDAVFVGIDRSTDAVASARARLDDRAEILQADVTGLADLPRPFDVVMMLEVLEHLDNPTAMLELLGELTTDQVIVSVPREPFFRGLNLLRLKNVKRFGSDPEHVQHWTGRGFERFVSEHFTIVDRGRAFPWTLLLLEPRRLASR